MEDDHKTRLLFSDAIRRTSETPQRFSVYDIIAKVTGQDANNARTTFIRLKDTHADLVSSKFEKYKFAGRGNNSSPVTDMITAWNVVRLVLSGSKIPLDIKRNILGELEYYPVRKYTEIELHNNIQCALAHVEIQFQYSVEGYRIDMYLPEYNIAVECDEYNHRAYSSLAETTRTEVISDALQCRWIRYDPYKSNFNIFQLINKIYVEMEAK